MKTQDGPLVSTTPQDLLMAVCLSNSLVRPQEQPSAPASSDTEEINTVIEGRLKTSTVILQLTKVPNSEDLTIFSRNIAGITISIPKHRY
jgi:hypothetical protein